jgi:hypothetical protein
VPVLQAYDPKMIVGFEVHPVALYVTVITPEAAPLEFVATVPVATIGVPPQV